MILIDLYLDTVEIECGKIRMNILDLGGSIGGLLFFFLLLFSSSYSYSLFHCKTFIVRRKWPEFYISHGIEGVVFIIDAADENRFDEAKEELNKFLDIPEWLHIPVLILGNKIDISRAVSEEKIRKYLEFPSTTTTTTTTATTTTSENKEVRYHNHDVMLSMCSIVRRIGYGDGKFKITYFSLLPKIKFNLK